MHVELRIVAGSLKGRKINCNHGPHLRPTPPMVREALFSILGNAVPERPFFDLFACTGANGFEAISRGASFAYFVERDVRLANEIDGHVKDFGVADQARVIRTDVYRWVSQWIAPAEAANVFISPPFADFQNRLEEFAKMVTQIQEKVADGSVVVIQTEKQTSGAILPGFEAWEARYYGRNILLIWVK